ncbi:MAG: hypothetical protein Q7R73_04320 [bacterium]|nr:hypothetical protein [bacterium]
MKTTKRAVAGLRHEDVVRRKLATDSRYARLYREAAALTEVEAAELELQCAVAKVLNRVARHQSGKGYDRNFYETLSKKSGVSSRSLGRFLESGCNIRKAAKILYPLGYRISKVSIKKLPKHK